MKKINILLLGAHINSSNLGCQALTYSLVNFLEKISATNRFITEYYVFEYKPDIGQTKKFKNNIGMKDNQLSSYQFPFAVTFKDNIRNVKSFLTLKKILKKVDLAVDVTSGDSFADIYGDGRFLATTKIKEVVEKAGIPLILGPQTYGPFDKKENELYAAKIIKNAYKVITRDCFSAEYVKNITGEDIPVTTDLAFQLPYIKNRIVSDKINIGINISGLLVKQSVETGFVSKNNLKTDYDEYINLLLQKLTEDNKYDIYLISHVEEDYIACLQFNKKYPTTKLVNTFNNPMDAKSFISGMDIFIGARMHATIGAFTSGVVTIPTAYSRKFETMFSVVNYDIVVDLQKLCTKEALDKTNYYISYYQDIRKKVDESLIIAESYKQKTEDFFTEAILKVLQRKEKQ